MGGLEDLIAEVEKRLAEMTERLVPYQAAGIVLGDDGRAQVSKTVRDGKAYVLWGPKGQEPRFDEVGEVSQGKLVADPRALVRYPQGTPIFVRAR
jgi:hypothetical protein